MVLCRFGRRMAVMGLGLVFSVAACESESTGPGVEAIEGELTVDASSQSAFTYVNLETGQVVSVTDPSTSTDWQLAFRRFEVRLNGGVSGPGSVVGFNLANNENATDDQIVQFTPENQLATFEAVGTADVPAADQFVEDGLVPNPASWFFFNPAISNLSADPSQAWKMDLGNDGYALFRVAALTLDGSGQALATVTFEWRLQGTTGTLGSIEQLTVDVSQGPAWVDFNTGASVASTGCAWDVTIGPSFLLDVNSACSVGTFPLDVTEDFTALTTADDAPDYGPFVSGIAGAVPSDFESNLSPFRYNLQGDNRLSPTFNVYLVQVGARVFKLQLIDYYSATGQSGFPTVRYAEIP
jgi:HmuY protein